MEGIHDQIITLFLALMFFISSFLNINSVQKSLHIYLSEDCAGVWPLRGGCGIRSYWCRAGVGKAKIVLPAQVIVILQHPINITMFTMSSLMMKVFTTDLDDKYRQAIYIMCILIHRRLELAAVSER